MREFWWVVLFFSFGFVSIGASYYFLPPPGVPARSVADACAVVAGPWLFMMIFGLSLHFFRSERQKSDSR